MRTDPSLVLANWRNFSKYSTAIKELALTVLDGRHPNEITQLVYDGSLSTLSVFPAFYGRVIFSLQQSRMPKTNTPSSAPSQRILCSKANYFTSPFTGVSLVTAYVKLS